MTRAWMALVLLLLPLVSVAHEGESHGGDAAAPAIARTRSWAAATDQLELVLSAPTLEPGHEVPLELCLADGPTNAPVSVAVIDLQLFARAGGEPIWHARAIATEAPGVFTASLAVPPVGRYNLLATVSTEAGEAKLALSAIDVTAPERHAAGRPRALAWIAIAAAALVLLTLLAAWFTRRRAAAALLVPLALVMLGPGRAHAHEGHDAAPVASTASEVRLGKASQFLLGVRTEPAVLARLSPTRELTGRVAPRSGSEVDVVAPQAGELRWAGGRAPVLGDRLARGRGLGWLVVVDSLALRAPIGGVVTGVFAAPGQRVEAGQKLATILDPSTVWVHADVFERDIAAVEHGTRAQVTSEAWPGVVFPARRVTSSPAAGELPGAIEAWYQVPNPAGRLRIGLPVRVAIEVAAAEPLATVPERALVQRGGHTGVWVKVAPERFALREVHVVARDGERAGVRGLDVGARVVIEGAASVASAPATER